MKKSSLGRTIQTFYIPGGHPFPYWGLKEQTWAPLMRQDKRLSRLYLEFNPPLYFPVLLTRHPDLLSSHYTCPCYIIATARLPCLTSMFLIRFLFIKRGRVFSPFPLQEPSGRQLYHPSQARSHKSVKISSNSWAFLCGCEGPFSRTMRRG